MRETCKQTAAPGRLGLDGAEKTTMMLPPMKGGSPEEQLIPTSPPPAKLRFIGGGEVGVGNSLTDQKESGFLKKIELARFFIFYCNIVIVKVCLPKASAAFRFSMCKSILFPTIAPPVSPAIAMP